MAQQNCRTASERIAHFAVRFAAHRLSEAQRKLIARSFADTFAVALAGRDEPATRSTLQYLERSGMALRDAPHGGATATLWGTPYRASAEMAALYNGLAAHVLDYDDVTVPMRGHPSVVLWPALIALGEVERQSGETLLEAWCVGFEVICKLSRVMAAEQYREGWHCTASIGVLGATVACCRLLGLDEAQIVNAIGLAVAQCAGSRENVGTEAKSFQAAQTNASAVRAALLAQAGLQASPDALDGPHGYTTLYGQRESLDVALDSLGEGALELELSGLDVKQYPMCYATHRTLDGVLALRREYGLDLERVKSAHIHTSRGALLPLTRHRPQTGLEGKFSIEYAVAAALADGHVRLTSFTDEAVRRPELQQFFECVHTSESDGPMEPRGAQIKLQLTDGTTLERHVETLRGSTQHPLSDEELCEKLDDCLAWSDSTLHAQRLFDLALTIVEHDVDVLVAQLSGH
jgi:2-methylcitrate dehydratase PrpD